MDFMVDCILWQGEKKYKKKTKKKKIQNKKIRSTYDFQDDVSVV